MVLVVWTDSLLVSAMLANTYALRAVHYDRFIQEAQLSQSNRAMLRKCH